MIELCDPWLMDEWSLTDMASLEVEAIISQRGEERDDQIICHVVLKVPFFILSLKTEPLTHG